MNARWTMTRMTIMRTTSLTKTTISSFVKMVATWHGNASR